MFVLPVEDVSAEESYATDGQMKPFEARMLLQSEMLDEASPDER